MTTTCWRPLRFSDWIRDCSDGVSERIRTSHRARLMRQIYKVQASGLRWCGQTIGER